MVVLSDEKWVLLILFYRKEMWIMFKSIELRQQNMATAKTYGCSMSYFVRPNYALGLDLHKDNAIMFGWEPNCRRLRC